MDEQILNKISCEIRKEIVKMHANSQSSHVASALSCVDILVALYFGVLKIDPRDPQDSDRDRFLLSKGHAASALYATLAMKGFFKKDILKQYCADGGILPGHSSLNSVPGIEVSTGSLGHGLSIGTGIALAAKHDRKHYKTYVLLSDGECDEGSTWEAAMFASHSKLDNLVVIVDYNKIQAFGRTEEVLNLEPFAEKWKAFGWEAMEIDGHDIKKLGKSLRRAPFKKNRPSVIIAHTVKGKGISFMEDKLLWHYRSPSKDDLDNALKELG